MKNHIKLITLILFFSNYSTSQVLIYTEDLETDGEGTRYASNVFNDGANDLWTRWQSSSNTQGPNNNLYAPYAGFIGNFSWCGEDTDGGGIDNPLGATEDGYFVIQTLDVSSYAGGTMEVRIWLAGSQQGFRYETDDFVAVQSAFDADIATGANSVGGLPTSTAVNTGNYSNVGAFFGIIEAPSTTSGELHQDADLDGFGDPTGAELNETLTQYTFTYNVPATASNMSVRVRAHTNTGSEECVFDQIEIYGTAFSCTDPDIPVVSASPGSICPSGSSTLSWAGANLNDATAWHVYSGFCGGTLVGTTTGTTMVVSPGSTTNYFVRGEGGCVTPGSCSAMETVTVNSLDDASFTYSAAAYCVNDSDPTPTLTGLGGGSFSSTAGLSINGGTGAIDLSISTPGTYTVTYTTSGPCPNSSNVAVTINGLDDPSFSYSAASYCVNASDPTPTITGLGGGGFTSAPAGLSISPATGAIDVSASTPGTYTVTYTTVGICPNSSNVSVAINALPTVSFTAISDLCLDAGVQSGLGGGMPTGGVYSGTGITDDGNGTSYSFDPAVAGVGTHTITYTVGVSGCSGSANDDVEVFALPTVLFTAPADLCVDAGVQTGLGGGTATGGVYSGPGVTDNGNGTTYSFDPVAAGVGMHTITYTFSTANGCTGSFSDAVEVFDLPTVTFTALADLCIDASVQTGLGVGSPTGGTYSGTGVTDDGNGTTYSFDPTVAGVGTHTVTYTFTNVNGCTNSANDDVEVFALPTMTFTALADLCLDAGVQSGLGGGTPTGGIYSGTGITDDGNGMSYSFDPVTAGTGVHTITYTYSASGCAGSTNDDVEVLSLPSITVDLVTDALCADSLDGAIDVTSSGNGALTFDWDNDGTGDNDDTEDLSGLADGTYSLTVIDANGCSATSSSTVSEPTPVAITIDNANNPSACGATDGGIDVTVTGGAGTYTFDWDNDGTGDNDDLEDLSGLMAGTYNLMVRDMNGCPGIASVSISDPAAPMITFTALTDLCENEVVQTVMGGATPTGGVYSGTGVTDNGDGMTYDFNPAAAGAGVHTITYTYTDGTGCTGFGSDDVEVFAIQAITASTITDITCSGAGDGSISVTVGGSGLSYDWSVDGTGDFNDPQNLAGLDSGTYVLQVMSGNGCVISQTFNIAEPAPLSLSGTSTDELLGSDGTINLTVSGGTPNYIFDWDNDGTGDNDDTEDLSGLTAGNYTVIVYDDNGCSDTLTLDVGTQVSVNDINNLSFSIYPNPNQGEFILNLELNQTHQATMIIHTLTGRLVHTQQVINSTNNIDVSDLERGIYMITIKTQTTQKTFRFVLN